MNRRAALGLGAGGLVPRRPDQASRPPQGVVIGPGSKNVIRARQIIIFGTGPGLFIYIGTPGRGTLVLAAVGQAGTDPTGQNTVSPVLNIGVWDAATGLLKQHFGVDQNGKLYLADATGATRITLDPATASQLIYNAAGVGPGNLTTSVASLATTDSAGNTVDAGLVSYTANVVVQIFAGTMNVGTPSQIAGTGGAIPSKVGLNLSNQPAILELNSGEVASGDVQSLFDVESANASGVTGGQINATTGQLTALLPDGSTYRTERLSIDLTSNFIINSTSPQTLFSAPLGVGRYEIDVWMVTSNTTAADAAGFAFAFTGTTLFPLVDFESLTTGTATVGYGASSTLTTSFNGQGVAGNQRVLMHATVQVSVAGTLTLTGKELVAANTVTVFAGSRMRVYPVA